MSRRLSSLEKQLVLGLLAVSAILVVWALVSGGGRKTSKRNQTYEETYGLLPYEEARASPPRDPSDVSRSRVEKLAFEAYPTWAASNPNKSCPLSIYDLASYTAGTETVDEWFNPLRMYCGPDAPLGTAGLGVASPGRDAVFDTADDIKSWDP